MAKKCLMELPYNYFFTFICQTKINEVGSTINMSISSISP